MADSESHDDPDGGHLPPKLSKMDEFGQSRKKHQRRRKKALYKAIVDQMEFYMGDANVSKSNFMKERFKTSPWLDVDVFLTFNKMAGMLKNFFGHSDNTDDLWKALKSVPSDIIELGENGDEKKRQIRRTKPVPAEESLEDQETKTIYVERLPPNNVDNDVLKKLFEKFGKVAYVSMPRYKHNRTAKGFAFVEFQDEEGMKKALESYVEAKRRINPENLDPADLQSVKSYHIEMQEAEGKPVTDKVAESETDQEGCGDSGVENGEAKEKKKSKKRKRKRKESTGSAGQPADPLTTLQVMPKTEWRRLRNKYLNLQRKNVGASKAKMRQFLEKRQVEEKAEETPAAEKKPEIQFVPNLIVRFATSEPIEDDKKVKQRVKAAVMDHVGYVDANIGASQFFVRCSNPDQAKTLANAKMLGQSTILSGDEEKSYWEKIMRDREEKLDGKVKRAKKPRGKLRVIKKYETMRSSENSHKFFSDDA